MSVVRTSRAAALTACSVGNLALGLALQWYVLGVLGPGYQTDAYFAAATVPAILLAVINGSLMHVLVPLLAGEEPAAFRAQAWTFFGAAGVLFGGLALVLAGTSALWVPWLVPGFSPAARQLAVELTVIQLVAMVFSAWSGVLAGVHHARARFVVVEASFFGVSLLSLGCLAWALPRYGIVGVAWVTVVRSALQAAVLLPGLGAFARPDLGAPIVGVAWRRVRPLIAGTIYYKSGPMVDRFLASLAAPGSLSLLNLCQQMYQAANDLVNKVVIGPLVPLLVRHLKAGDDQAFRRSYRRRALGLGLATSAGYVALLAVGYGLLGRLVGVGSIGAADVDRLWQLIVAMGGFLVFGLIGQSFAAAFYATGETHTVTKIGVLGFTLGVGLKVILFGRLGLVGIPVGAGLHQLINALALFIVLERRRAGSPFAYNSP